MVDYVDNVETEIATGKPIKASTGLKMVRNVLAIITGGANAPEIENAAFADKSISGAKLADNSISGSKLADNSIGGSKLADNSIGGSKLADNSISGSKLADDSIPATKLKNNLIGYGNCKIAAFEGSVGTISESFELVYEHAITVTGNLRIKFRIAPVDSGVNVQAIIHRNGVQVGTTHSTSSGLNVIEDVSGWKDQDCVQVWLKVSNYLFPGQMTDFQICGDKYISSISVYSKSVPASPM